MRRGGATGAKDQLEELTAQATARPGPHLPPCLLPFPKWAWQSQSKGAPAGVTWTRKKAEGPKRLKASEEGGNPKSEMTEASALLQGSFQGAHATAPCAQSSRAKKAVRAGHTRLWWGRHSCFQDLWVCRTGAPRVDTAWVWEGGRLSRGQARCPCALNNLPNRTVFLFFPPGEMVGLREVQDCNQPLKTASATPAMATR